MNGFGDLRARVRAPLAVRKFLPAPLALGARGMGALALFAIGLTAVGSSIYFALGVVAGHALGLTPVAFLLAGVFFVLTMMTYVEGGVLHQERGGASSLARYAFNELWSFIAGWAILLDYLIVIAISVFSISHYLVVLWPDADNRVPTYAIAAVAILAIAALNIRGLPVDRLRLVLGIGMLNLVVLFAVLAVGLTLFSDPKVATDTIHLGSAPEWRDLIFGLVVATVALTSRRQRWSCAVWSCLARSWCSSSSWASRRWVSCQCRSAATRPRSARSTSRRRCWGSSISSTRPG
jgi:amino acid transporter